MREKRTVAKKLMLAALALTLVLGLCGCGEKETETETSPEVSSASDAANGVVRVCSVFSDSLLGTEAIGTGTAFGVGTVGEETDIFVTNRHVVTEENASGGYTVADRVYIMLDENSYNVDYYYIYINGELVELNGENSIVIDGEVYLLANEREYDVNTSRMIECDVVDYSDEYDIAILRAVEKVENRIALELADTAEMMNVAETVYALGYPAYTNEVTDLTSVEDTGVYYVIGTSITLPIYTRTKTYTARIEDQTITSGVVSRYAAVTDENDTPVIQHDATINEGNSGGPLVNSDGVVVGVNTWGATTTESGNYSIYIDIAKDMLDENDIEYDVAGESDSETEEDSEGFDIPVPAIIGIIAAAAVIVLVVIFVLVLNSRKKESNQTQQNSQIPETITGAGQIPDSVGQTLPQPESASPNDSGFRIQGMSGVYANRRFAISGVLKLGRDPQVNQISYPANVKGISRVHCEIYAVNGQVYIRDLGSTYGTFLGNGQKLMANQPTALMPGDQFYLGTPEELFVITRKGGL